MGHHIVTLMMDFIKKKRVKLTSCPEEGGRKTSGIGKKCRIPTRPKSE